MGIQTGDLRNTVSRKLSIDEFEPKTGSIEDVIVFSMFVTDEDAGADLYSFFDTSVIDINDIEVSPNPNENDYFVVFVEIPRNKKSLETIRALVKDAENVVGPLSWVASTHLTDEYFPLDSDELEQYVILDPESYMTRDEWKEQQEKQRQLEIEEELSAEQEKYNAKIHEFLSNSMLESVDIDEDTIFLKGSSNIAQLRIVGFGRAQETMEQVGISQDAIGELTYELKKFNNMLGEMRAIPIGSYIVIYHPELDDILIGEKC